MSETNALEVEGLTVRFGQTVVLETLSFSVPRATSLAIIGPNGSGKTVLFRSLIGALPHEGRVRWAPGTKIGYVPQKLDLERDLPVRGEDFLRAKAAVTRARAKDVLRARDLVRLGEPALKKPIGTLSGGQFQRLLVAAALVGGPTVLLLDEPTAGVDEPGQEHLNETIERLRTDEALTIMLISHDLSVVYRYAQNVLCLASPTVASRVRGSANRAATCFGAPQSVLTPALLESMYGTPIRFHAHTDEHRA